MAVDSREQLTQKKCLPCEGGVAKMSSAEAREQIPQLQGWELTRDDEWIEKRWRFKNFREAMAFINQVAELAEDEGHHPDIHVEGYRNVRIEISTHAIGGLSKNDFILAAKIDDIST